MTDVRKKSLCLATALVLAGLVLSAASAAYATPITYTFTGTGSGTIGTTSFTDATFTFVFTADTTAIDASGAPFYRLTDVAGMFSEDSSSVTLTPTVSIVATADATTPRINFFNATFDNGLGINDPSLASYELSTSFGPLTVAAPGTATSFLTPTVNAMGDGFPSTGGVVEITANTSLTFTAALQGPAVPEPASLALLGTALAGFGFGLRRRRKPA